MLSKYYTQDYATIKEQKAFEKALFEKTKKSNSMLLRFFLFCADVDIATGKNLSLCLIFTAIPTLGEIIMFDGHVIVFKNTIDVFIYAVGSPDENELMLMSVLQAYYDALGLLLKYVRRLCYMLLFVLFGNSGASTVCDEVETFDDVKIIEICANSDVGLKLKKEL